MRKASVIFLNGPCSAGKSTLGRGLQRLLEDPFFYFSSDQMVEARMVPETPSGLRGLDPYWQEIRPAFFAGFHRCIAALAAAGNSVIVEHVLEQRSWLDECQALLEPFDVFYVGVHCPLEELERRERARGDRRAGEARSHLADGVYDRGPYDFEIDTSLRDPEENARLLRDAYLKRTRPGAFRKKAV